MTAEERQARRDMILKAAKDREQAWDKKVAGGRKAGQASDSKVDLTGRPIFDHSVAASIGSSNPETQRQVEEIRKAEEKQAKVSFFVPNFSTFQFHGNHHFCSVLFCDDNDVHSYRHWATIRTNRTCRSQAMAPLPPQPPRRVPIQAQMLLREVSPLRVLSRALLFPVTNLQPPFHHREMRRIPR